MEKVALVKPVSQLVECTSQLYQPTRVFADADVDAANLALVTEAVPLESHAYWGSQSAEINAKLCDRCDLCFQICRFNAIHKPENPQQDYSVIDLLCEAAQHVHTYVLNLP